MIDLIAMRSITGDICEPRVGRRRRLDTPETLAVIVCSCNGITADEVRACATASHCRQTVSQIVRALNRTPGCGTCSRTILGILREVEAEHTGRGDCHICPVRAQLDAAKSRAGGRPAPVYDFLPQEA
ncbi:MAG: (2Fe-2S)-binding protein [Ancalomicrobiaceae bacterium]|nr:(2Fe-2S)-binding protein [Ancalomicrobiaceae bacterium]